MTAHHELPMNLSVDVDGVVFFLLILIKTTMKILYMSPGKHMVLCKVACRRVGKLMVLGYENV